MKKLFSLLKPLPAILIMLTGILFLPAQTIQYLNSNNVNAGIGVGGNLFTQLDSFSNAGRFQTPKGGDAQAIFTQSLWLTGLDSSGSLHCAANRYFDYGKDFFDGPIAPAYNAAYDTFYNRVFKITQAQIAQFKTLTFPTTSNLVDSAILYWPAKGNASVLNSYGISIGSTLAPFVDLNGNGIYEPLSGEYPAICGDEGIFFVYNDIRLAHTQTNGTPFGVEIRGMANSFTDSTLTILPYTKRAVNNAVFIHYEIENKSSNNYNSFDFGQWLDPDMGCFSNDRVGCDPTRNLMFAYNGVLSDPDCAPENGYGSLPVSLGVKILNQPMNVFGYFTGLGAPDTSVSDPITAAQYRYYTQGLWADGSPFINNGTTGYGGNLANTTTFLFPGDPNDTTQWSDQTSGIAPGDRRMYSSTNNLTFSAGEIMHFDYVFFSSFDTTITSNYHAIVDTLKRDADILQAFYNNTVALCQSQLALGINQVETNNAFTVSVYPNPANNLVTIQADNDIQAIELIDIAGRVIISKQVGAKYLTVPVSNIAKGVYLLNVQSGGNIVIKKIVVE